MADETPGPSLGELRAASANLMVAAIAASSYPFQQALKAEADRQDYLVRAQTVGVSQEDAERILAEITEDRSNRGLPLEPVYRLALTKVYGSEAYVSLEQKFMDSLPGDKLRALEQCADGAALLQRESRDTVLWALVHVMAAYCDGGEVPDV